MDVRVYLFFSFVDKDGIFLDKIGVEGLEGHQCHIPSIMEECDTYSCTAYRLRRAAGPTSTFIKELSIANGLPAHTTRVSQRRRLSCGH